MAAWVLGSTVRSKGLEALQNPWRAQARDARVRQQWVVSVDVKDPEVPSPVCDEMRLLMLGSFLTYDPLTVTREGLGEKSNGDGRAVGSQTMAELPW